MNKQVDISYFNKQLSCSISYQNFLCDYVTDEKSFYSNKILLSGLYEVKNGVCANPSLIMDLINPKDAKMGKIKPFKAEYKDINESQYRAVCMALGMNNLMVLEGPPGTGKTSVIIELIKQLKIRDKSTRILITSQSHLAVDNVIEDFINNGEYINQIARIRQKDHCEFKKYSELAIFNKMHNSADGKLNKILESFDDVEDERYGNDFLKSNVCMVLNDKSIVGVTCNSIPGCHFENGEDFDYVIIDEVGKFSFCELINVAKIAKKLILIGDPQQLPAVIVDRDKDNGISFINVEGFNRDDYTFLKQNNYIDDLFNSISAECKTKLTHQYRMSNAIGIYISQTYYNGELLNGKDKDIKDAINFIDYSKKLKTAYISSMERKKESEDSDLENIYEVNIIKLLLNGMLANVPRKKIAIITPYRKQADLIIKNIKKFNLFSKILSFKSISVKIPREKIARITPYRKQANLKFNNVGKLEESHISTVDSFQGKEYEYIIFSCVRCAGSSSFLDDRRRINVAVSRAKEKIFVIGCGGYLTYNTTYIKSLIQFKMLYTNPHNSKQDLLSCKHWFATEKNIRKYK